MIRPIKFSLFVFSLGVVCLSFAFGRHLRLAAAGPVHTALSPQQYAKLAGAEPVTNGAESISRNEGQNNDISPADTFQEVLRRVKGEYVDRISDDNKLSYGAVRYMVLSLDDPKTRFLDPNQRKAFEDQMNGQFSGIGAIVTVVKQKTGDVERRRLTVVAPVPGSPAEKAGIHPGDVITTVNDHWIIAYDPQVDLNKLRPGNLSDEQFRKLQQDAIKRFLEGITLPKALDQLASANTAHLKLVVERPGTSTPLKIDLDTTQTTVDPVEYKALNDRVGYLRVTQFNDRATEAITNDLDGIHQKELVVDLRDNAGGAIISAQSGALKSALALIGRLTSGGQVGSVLHRGGRSDSITVAPSNHGNFKMAVLINGGTANVAEFVAAALKQKAGATLIGTHSFGDSTMQKFVALHDGTALTVLAGKFMPINGKDFGSKGLLPDIALSTGAPHAADDPAVERAVRTLSGS